MVLEFTADNVCWLATIMLSLICGGDVDVVGGTCFALGSCLRFFRRGCLSQHRHRSLDHPTRTSSLGVRELHPCTSETTTPWSGLPSQHMVGVEELRCATVQSRTLFIRLLLCNRRAKISVCTARSRLETRASRQTLAPVRPPNKRVPGRSTRALDPSLPALEKA